MADAFHDMPDSARLWVIGVDRDLEPQEQAMVHSRLADFFGGWHSHGRKVVAAATIERDRFIVVAAFVPGDDVSGCGIDASVHELDEIAQRVGFTRAPALDIFYDSGGGVRSVSRAEFAELIRSRVVTRDSIVFDTSLASAGDWRMGGFAKSLSKSWHADVFL